MSVIAYDLEELANAGACAISKIERGTWTATDSGKRTAAYVAGVLAILTKCNHDAYHASYTQEFRNPDYSAKEIEAAMRKACMRGVRRDAARALLSMLPYNCMGQDGVDYLTPEACRALLGLVTPFVRPEEK